MYKKILIFALTISLLLGCRFLNNDDTTKKQLCPKSQCSNANISSFSSGYSSSSIKIDNASYAVIDTKKQYIPFISSSSEKVIIKIDTITKIRYVFDTIQIDSNGYIVDLIDIDTIKEKDTTKYEIDSLDILPYSSSSDTKVCILMYPAPKGCEHL